MASRANAGLKRTVSRKDVGLVAPPPCAENEEPDAKSFLRQTARRSLDKVLEGASASGKKEKEKEKEKEKSRKGSDKKEKDGKKKKKKKKKVSSESSESTKSSDAEADGDSQDQDDAMGVLGLAKKDVVRPDTARKLDELSCRQLAFAMSGIHEGLTAYDVYEIGGELEGLNSTRALSIKKQKQTLHDVSSVIRSLARRHERKIGQSKIAESLENQLSVYKKAAEQDLEKQMTAREDKGPGSSKENQRRRLVRPTSREKKEDEGLPKKRPKPSTRKPDSEPKHHMIEDAKKEEVSEEEPDDPEPLPEPPLELEDGDAESPDPFGSDDDEDAGDSEQNDDDIFADEFALPAKADRNKREPLPEKLRKEAATMSKDLLDSIPSEMSMSLAYLVSPYIQPTRPPWTGSDKVPKGKLSDHLGASGHIYKRMTLKGKTCFKKWIDGFPEYYEKKFEGAFHAREAEDSCLICDTDTEMLDRTEDSQRHAIRDRLLAKIEFMDQAILQGKKVLDVDGPAWEAALELHRQDYFKLGVFIRPKLFYEPEEQPPEAPPEARMDGQGREIAAAWHVDVLQHMIRKGSYRGSVKNLTPGKLKLPFDALTAPAAYVLQTRGCPLGMQTCTLETLELLVHPLRDTDFDVILVRDVDECKLAVRSGEVLLSDWQDFLQYCDLNSRWSSTRFLSPVMQSLDSGVPLHVVLCFLLRLPYEEVLK
ncbi:unnamed protein product, partial [Symbiodinium microadriaticum]